LKGKVDGRNFKRENQAEIIGLQMERGKENSSAASDSLATAQKGRIKHDGGITSAAEGLK